uniref:Putative SIS domain-containing protein n=1 Tax=viral metagenome TaxID=1070528 RepID=A0A6M3JBB1_9ZZZZ
MRIDTLVETYLKEQRGINFPIGEVARLVRAVIDTWKNMGRVFIFGNGGGASIADHFASDLAVHPFVSDDKHKTINKERMEVHCLNESMGLLTRLGNDLGYENIFVDQLKNYSYLNEDDLVIAFSVSGNSPNILKALEYASKEGVTTACIGKGGKAKDIVDISVEIKGASTFPGQVGANENYFHVEDLQGSIAHMITGLLKGVVNERT